MGRRRNPADESAGKSSGSSGEYTEPVKLRPAFKEKLQRVAGDLGKFMGQLIEERMAQFVNQENLRVLRKELEQAESEERRPKG